MSMSSTMTLGDYGAEDMAAKLPCKGRMRVTNKTKQNKKQVTIIPEKKVPHWTKV